MAGAYHPALGELVKSRIFLNKARNVLAGAEHSQSVVLGVSASAVSQMTGQHRGNIRTLCAEFDIAELKIRSCEAEYGEIRILSVAKEKKL